jgi:hypothetical protein
LTKWRLSDRAFRSIDAEQLPSTSTSWTARPNWAAASRRPSDGPLPAIGGIHLTGVKVVIPVLLTIRSMGQLDDLRDHRQAPASAHLWWTVQVERILRLTTWRGYETAAHHHYISCSGVLFDPCGWRGGPSICERQGYSRALRPVPRGSHDRGRSLLRTAHECASCRSSGLGVYRDAMQGIAGIVCYAVIFEGVSVPSYGPVSGPGGRELVVIVNARTGRVFEAFSYH